MTTPVSSSDVELIGHTFRAEIDREREGWYELHVRGLARATPFIHAECTDEGAEMSEHRVADPLVVVVDGA